MSKTKKEALAQIFFLFADLLEIPPSEKEMKQYAAELHNLACGMIRGEHEKQTGHLSYWGEQIRTEMYQITD